MLIIHETSSAEEKKHSSMPTHLNSISSEYGRIHFTKKVITDQELYFSSPDKFNDPYDCGLPFKQHADNSDPIKIKYMVKKTAQDIFHIYLEEIGRAVCKSKFY